MTRSVKGSYRQQQAAATREHIAASAREIFAEQGYGATSIDAIARRAGVAVRTIYATYGTKRQILSRICELWLEDAGARTLAEAVLGEPDPEKRLRGTAGWLTNLYASGFDVAEMFDGALGESSETRELLREKLAGRDEVLDAMVATLEPVLPGDIAKAQAILRALAAPGVYRALVIDAGWSSEDFTDWLTSCLRTPPAAAPQN